jgi:hypothetical protein
VTIVIKLFGHLGRDQDKEHEHAEVLLHTYIVDIAVATIIILLFVYSLFTSVLMFMEAIISIRQEFLYF